ncbi:YitT family protein [Caldalkalibacillus salinus]|uniref:YitT family protein n=1 Tax=Caldalkalibacillus salinus TaxID=2803787 RepID=UPI0019208EDB|nr:YitT family protein [Caldalkalibacillus salinus]
MLTKNDNKRKRKQPQRPRGLQIFLEYLNVFIGATIVGLAFNVFLFPHGIASGGVSGISTVVGHVLNIEPAITQWVLNIAFFGLGLLVLGKQFGLKTLMGTIYLPFAVYFTRNLEPVTQEPLLAALFGGIGVGLGLGIVFRGKASTGGTDLGAQIVHHYTGLSLGVAVLLMDGLVVASAAIFFNLELALYALIGLWVTSKTIDMVQVGLGYAKVAYIISSVPNELRNAILNDLDRGVTKLSGTGGYTESERPVLMCVVNQREVTKLKTLVRAHDPQAFVIVHNANEVLGEGFRGELHSP